MMCIRRVAWGSAGALWALLAVGPALADDTELFVGTTTGSQAKPNILFIIDNSISMQGELLTQADYDPNVTYPNQGACRPDRVYWRTGTGELPACSDDNQRWFNRSALKCNAALQAFASSGWYTDTIAQYDPSSDQRRWERISTSSSHRGRAVECRADRGVHGETEGSSSKYARNGNNSNGYWGDQSTEISWTSWPSDQIYTLFDGNYLNWAYGPTGLRQRIDIVKDVASDLLDTMTGVNVGLMHFNDFGGQTTGSQGGRVAHALEDIETARADLKATINALQPEAGTPLAETMYEAALYFAGREAHFGDDSVDEAFDPNDSDTYQSPIDYMCQRNFVVYLTDGEPTWDVSADSNIVGLTDYDGESFSSLVGGTCDAEAWAGIDFPTPQGGNSYCLDDLAEFMFEADLSPLEGKQNVTTYTVGFTVDLPLLAQTAERGGGEYYTANDTATLAGALTNIVRAILDRNMSFTAPTVAVNAFNRTQNLSDLFITMFRPSATEHWPGNVKKYRLRASDSTILDADNQPAVDPETGFFATGARSFWSPTDDGPEVTRGGAANLQPAPANRLVYTYLVGGDLTLPGNRVEAANALIDDEALNINPGDPTRAQVIDFINGYDRPDTDQDNDTNEPRYQMGDPLHAQPVTVVYGPSLRDGLLFVGTNDGYLHALDLDTGEEKWAFLPPEFLDDQVDLYRDESVALKNYGIDGNLRIQMVADNDSVIETGEKVYLFFGMRRGGSFYYGLDVTNPDAPQVMWRLDSLELPGLGEAWAAPVPTRIEVQGAQQNDDKLVLVIAGGYEPDQDNATASTDSVGNSIYIVDSVSGELLWHGSKDGTHKDFAVSGKSMDYSIPADIRVIDLDRDPDRLADRMYAADMGGQIWRFDIHNGQPPESLITGGVIAQLGAAPDNDPDVADVRRFYYAPDVAFANTGEYSFTHIGIGSGHRAHPLNESTNDRFYALRDYRFNKLTQGEYDAITPITDADLVPVTTVNTNVPKGSPGWRLDLTNTGEKVLAEARTFNNEVIFTTFRPGTSGISCEPRLGTNRIYRMNVFNGSPVTNLDKSVDGELTLNDLYIEGEGGILPAAQVAFTADDRDNDGIPDDVDPDADGDGVAENDIDGDGIPNAYDDDADGDGKLDDDIDGDGIPNSQDPDADGDGVLDGDIDGDGIPNDLDDDMDGDGVANTEDDDIDGDGVPNEEEEEEETEQIEPCTGANCGGTVACVGLICFPPGFENTPVRTFWTQESAD